LVAGIYPPSNFASNIYLQVVIDAFNKYKP